MVCDESHHILALSEYRGPPSMLSRGEPSAPLGCLTMGGQGLLEAAPAPREHPTPGPPKGEKVTGLLDTEEKQWAWTWLRAFLGPRSGSRGARGGSAAGREAMPGQPPSHSRSLGSSLQERLRGRGRLEPCREALDGEMGMGAGPRGNLEVRARC